MPQSPPHLEALSRKYPLKRAFITGAGNGLGLAFAMELAKIGWTIGITDVNKTSLETAVSLIENAGGKAVSYQFDVAEYDQFQNAVTDFEAKQSGIDIGINNAGIGCGGFMHEVPVETFRRVIDVDLMGVAYGCHLFVSMMRKQKAGHILNVASAAAFVTAPRMSAYNTAKAGVVALSETLRSELIDDGVIVTVLMPTYVKTNICRDAIGSSADNLIGEALVKESNLCAEEVAIATFMKMSKDELYVVLPRKAQVLWRFKRLMPNQFWRLIAGITSRKIAEIEQDSKSKV